jgi:hypothetical protein
MTLAGNLAATDEIIGDTATGAVFNQSGGTNTSSYLYLGKAVGASGTYILDGGSLKTTYHACIGDSGTGSFTQTGGSNTNGVLYLGNAVGASGTYTLNGGSLTTTNFAYIGNSGTGSFTQTDGTNTNNELYLGNAVGASGTYNLSGGSLSAGTSEYIGYSGSGSFTQTGGTNTMVSSLYLGFNTTGSGTYNLDGGSLSPQFGQVGYHGVGVFTQTDGTYTGSLLHVGANPGSSGTYNLEGGTLSSSTSLVIGSFGSGTFAQSGGSISAYSELIGWNGSGAFTQTAGTHTANLLRLGNNIGASGTYDLSNGSLSALGQEIGFSGTGTFTQTAGTNTATSVVYLGFNDSGSGTYALEGGSLSAPYEQVGVSGTGAFIQTGGTNSVGIYLSLGVNAGASSSYTLGGGTGSPVLSAPIEYIGDVGTAVFTQIGGTNNISNTLYLAANSGSGTYNLQGGSLQAANVNINSGGVFNQTGGSLNATTSLTNAGAYTMAGGTLTGVSLNNSGSFDGYGTINAGSVGFSNSGTMTLTGGDSTVNGDFYNQAGGSLTISYNQATFTGDVYNNVGANIKVNGAIHGDDSIFVRLGNFYNNGGYTSDPISNYFSNLEVGREGYLQGVAGDKFIISGDFKNNSTQNLIWNTAAADLVFTNVTAESINHLLYLTGADLGRTMAGYTDNFAWGSLDLTGQILTLEDGNDTDGGALYVGSILGATIEGGMVTDIFGNDLNIYYNSDLAANDYLGGLTYELMSGGLLAPVANGSLPLNPYILTASTAVQTPLPASVWLFLSGLAGLGLLRRKKFRSLRKN